MKRRKQTPLVGTTSRHHYASLQKALDALHKIPDVKINSKASDTELFIEIRKKNPEKNPIYLRFLKTQPTDTTKQKAEKMMCEYIENLVEKKETFIDPKDKKILGEAYTQLIPLVYTLKAQKQQANTGDNIFKKELMAEAVAKFSPPYSQAKIEFDFKKAKESNKKNSGLETVEISQGIDNFEKNKNFTVDTQTLIDKSKKNQNTEILVSIKNKNTEEIFYLRFLSDPDPKITPKKELELEHTLHKYFEELSKNPNVKIPSNIDLSRRMDQLEGLQNFLQKALNQENNNDQHLNSKAPEQLQQLANSSKTPKQPVAKDNKENKDNKDNKDNKQRSPKN